MESGDATKAAVPVQGADIVSLDLSDFRLVYELVHFLPASRCAANGKAAPILEPALCTTASSRRPCKACHQAKKSREASAHATWTAVCPYFLGTNFRCRAAVAAHQVLQNRTAWHVSQSQGRRTMISTIASLPPSSKNFADFRAALASLSKSRSAAATAVVAAIADRPNLKKARNWFEHHGSPCGWPLSSTMSKHI